MAGRRLVTLVTALLSATAATSALAQDNPILRERLEQKIVEELAEHNTQDTAWFNEKSVDRQKWTSGKLLGRKIRLASWTEQSKSWIWLEDPKSTLWFDLERLAIRDGRIEFSAKMIAKAQFKVWGRVPKLAQASVGGHAQAKIAIEGSARVGAGQLEDAKITRLQGSLEDLQFNNDLAHPWEDLSKDMLNDYLANKNDKLRRSLEKAINRVRF